MKKVLLLIFFASFCFAVPDIKASGASLYLSPNSGTFNIKSTFDVSIYLNTGEKNINAIKADLKFNPKKLQIVNPNVGKSFISIWAVPPSFSNTEGYLSFQGGIPSPGIKTSSGLISTIKFRAIDPGETTIYLINSSLALLDDGNGTDILNSYGRGVYNISILPPKGPDVFSLTHPDQNKWYKDNNPTFSWEREDGVNEFSYSIDQDSMGSPDNKPDENITSKSYSNLDDGIWYFHIKARKGEIWGGQSHYFVRIDNGNPASFSIEVSPSEKTSFKQPVISFFTTDAFSGIDHFEIKVIDISVENKKNNSFFVEASSPYHFSNLKIGSYTVIVRAYDKAGNWQDENIKLEIIPEEITITEKGLWLDKKFSPWWPFLLIIILLIIIIFIIYLFFDRKEKIYRKKIAQELKEKEEKIINQLKNIEDKNHIQNT